MIRLAALVVPAVPLFAQPVVGARAGVVSFAIGKVYLDSQPIEVSVTHFPDVKENSVLSTEGGRSEVLLHPCAVLRVDEDSSFRMIDSSLLTPRVELLGGSAVLDIAGIRRGSEIRLQMSGAAVEMARKGTYRIDYSPALLKVYEGQANVDRSGGKTGVSGGRALAFDSASPEKFDIRGGDALDLWNHQRAIVLARARGGRQLGVMDLAAAASRAHGADTGRRSSNGADPDLTFGGATGSAPATLRRPALDMGCKF
jgi:hypothetical protein